MKITHQMLFQPAHCCKNFKIGSFHRLFFKETFSTFNPFSVILTVLLRTFPTRNIFLSYQTALDKYGLHVRKKDLNWLTMRKLILYWRQTKWFLNRLWMRKSKKWFENAWIVKCAGEKSKVRGNGGTMLIFGRIFINLNNFLGQKGNF